MKKHFTILGLIVLSAGCAARPTPIPDGSSPDASLYAARCGACHSVPHPGRHTAEQWEHMVDVMEKEMKHRNMTPLTPEEKETILGYLTRNAR